MNGSQKVVITASVFGQESTSDKAPTMEDNADKDKEKTDEATDKQSVSTSGLERKTEGTLASQLAAYRLKRAALRGTDNRLSADNWLGKRRYGRRRKYPPRLITDEDLSEDGSSVKALSPTLSGDKESVEPSSMELRRRGRPSILRPARQQQPTATVSIAEGEPIFPDLVKQLEKNSDDSTSRSSSDDSSNFGYREVEEEEKAKPKARSSKSRKRKVSDEPKSDDSMDEDWRPQKKIRRSRPAVNRSPQALSQAKGWSSDQEMQLKKHHPGPGRPRKYQHAEAPEVIPKFIFVDDIFQRRFGMDDDDLEMRHLGVYEPDEEDDDDRALKMPLAEENQCNICSRSFPTNPSLATHMHHAHKILASLRCSMCRKWYRSVDILRAHISQVHGLD